MPDDWIAHLGTAEHVAVILERWAASVSDFKKVYVSRPLGANISIAKTEEDTGATDVHFIVDNDLESRLTQWVPSEHCEA